MRMNKRQLRRIIREEKRRVLREMHHEGPSGPAGMEYQSDMGKMSSRQVAAKSMDLFGKLNSAVDQLLMRGMDPIELANELRGLADDVEASAQMSYGGSMDESDKASDGFDREEREAAGEYDDAKKKEKKPKAQDMR